MKSVILCLMLAVCVGVFGGQDYAFFDSQDAPTVNLPQDKFYPAGSKFLFGLFSVLSPDLEKLKDDGFTAIGPYYGDQTKAGVLEKAKSTGLKCLYRVGRHINFVNDPNYVMPTDEQIVEEIRAEIMPVINDDRIMCWYLGNEELRHWKPDEMRWLDVATQTIRELDRHKRPIWMYEPNHRPADGLAKTVVYQDYCGKGFYANLAGYQNNRIWIKWSMEQQAKAIELSGNKNAIAICVPEMCCDPQPQYHQLIPQWCRHDVYCSVVNGAKGVVIWSGFRRSGLSTYDLYYQGYSSVSRELNGPLALGQVLLFGKQKNRIKTEIIDGVKTVTLRPTLGTIEQIEECIRANRLSDANIDYSPLSTIELSYKGCVYYFIVNSASADVKAAVSGLPRSEITSKELFANTVPQIKNGIFQVEPKAYDVRCYKFSPKL